MKFDSISLTLFDLLGYLLPGFVFLLCFSILEATFFHSTVFSLSAVSAHPAFFSVVAYFLGHVAHALGSEVKRIRFRWFTSKQDRLGKQLYSFARHGLSFFAKEGFGDAQEKPSALDFYVVAESYLIATGHTQERDLLIAREGFYKASMVPLGLLAGVLLSSLFHGGASIIYSDDYQLATASGLVTGLSTVGAVLLTVLFRRRYMFFNRLKNSHVLVTASVLSHLDAANRQAASEKK